MRNKLILFRKVKLVNICIPIHFWINIGSQYGTIVIASLAAGNFSRIGLKVLFEPIIGLGISYRYIGAAQTAAERRARIVTLAALLSVSGTSALTPDPATNLAVGACVASKIAYMRRTLTLGGGN